LDTHNTRICFLRYHWVLNITVWNDDTRKLFLNWLSAITYMLNKHQASFNIIRPLCEKRHISWSQNRWQFNIETTCFPFRDINFYVPLSRVEKNSYFNNKLPVQNFFFFIWCAYTFSLYIYIYNIHVQMFYFRNKTTREGCWAIFSSHFDKF